MNEIEELKHEEDLTQYISKQLTLERQYLSINSTTLLYLNNAKVNNQFNQERQEYYAQKCYKQLNPSENEKYNTNDEPHIYDLASKAYYHMRRLGQDQGFLLTGISGSGKSTNSNLILKQLCYLGKKGHNGLEDIIEHIQTVIKSFTTIELYHSNKGEGNPDSTHATMFSELQFSTKGKLIGIKTLLLDLENMNSGLNNKFLVFYQAYHGLDAQKKMQYKLGQLEDLNYLADTKTGINKFDYDTGYRHLIESLKCLGFKAKTREKITQLLVSILLIGNLEFQKPTLDNEAAQVINLDLLSDIAEMLGVKDVQLHLLFQQKVKKINGEYFTNLLDLNQALIQKDQLSNLLYGQLVYWIIEEINAQFCKDDSDVANYMALLDYHGFYSNTKALNSASQFFDNYINEVWSSFLLESQISIDLGLKTKLLKDNITSISIIPSTMDIYPSLRLLSYGDLNLITNLRNQRGTNPGIIRQIQNNGEKKDFNLLTSLNEHFGGDSEYLNMKNTRNVHGFGIRHFASHTGTTPLTSPLNIDSRSRSPAPTSSQVTVQEGKEVYYQVHGFLEFDKQLVSNDMINLFDHNYCTNEFLIDLFQPGNKIFAKDINQKDALSSIRGGLTRKPSRKNKKNADKKDNEKNKFAKITQTMNEIIDNFQDAQLWNIVNFNCINYNTHIIQTQVIIHKLDFLRIYAEAEFMVDFSFSEFLKRYELILNIQTNNEDALLYLQKLITEFTSNNGWEVGLDYLLGKEKIHLTYQQWKLMEDSIRQYQHEIKTTNKIGAGDMWDEDGSVYDQLQQPTLNYDVEDEEALSSFKERALNTEMEQDNELHITGTRKKKVKEEKAISGIRKSWLRLVWLLTFWIPTCCLRRRGMIRKDVQLAWREKVALVFIIVWSWFLVLFVNIGIGLILCPPSPMWTPTEISTLQGPKDLGVFMYGKVYDITDFAKINHGANSGFGATQDQMEAMGGMDVTYNFPVPLNLGCPSLGLSDTFKLTTNSSDPASNYFVHTSGPLTLLPTTDFKNLDWFFKTATPKLKRMIKGTVVHDPKDLASQKLAGGKISVIHNKVYDLTSYFATTSDPAYAGSKNNTSLQNPHFLPSTVEQMFDTYNLPYDVTSYWENKSGLSDKQKNAVLSCMNNIFYIGDIDSRDSARCQATNYLLLSSTGVVLLITLVKFLAALQLSGKRNPQDYDKFVICQVPCYTEGEESIKRTIDSLAVLDYEDKYKLLFIIADGLIIGSGNEKDTPRIVLDILGIDPMLIPEKKAFRSIGDPKKQLNYGQVYSGLYECEGHVIPYVVVVKVGNQEASKAGNRGKRDSQIILMNFLNKVHFQTQMTPLELEIYYQIRNVIGVDPKFYEFILMVDADTEVMPDSLTRLVSVMARDGRVMGLCGETALSNENQSITTMMQVYEYYISHNLAKAFESLFGSVTCLPGCFCMYRIRTIRDNPLIIHNNVIKDYSENLVDTLHKKNLLSLGEDRYLTTLMLKHFPNYKMKFTPDALCRTVAPDKFAVLLSQRRRWINSTIHNFFELIFLKDMCGFCCFSMRFVVLLDLIGTIILPATVIYIIYIIVAAILKFQYISTVSIIIMSAIYILQALLFIIKQKWEHVGWMFFYLLAMGLFNFYIPIYSFWHFDDFSWGNTRLVIDGDGKKQVVNEEDLEDYEFDPTCIPLQTWADYEIINKLGPNESFSNNPNEINYDSAKFSSNYLDQSRLQFNQPTSVYDFNSRPQSPALSQVNRHSMRQSQMFTNGSNNLNSSYIQPVPQNVSFVSENMNPNQSTHRMSLNRPFDQQRPTSMQDFPSEDQLLNEIKRILGSSDLMSISKKQVRERLSDVFDIDVNVKKEFVNSLIEYSLANVNH